MLVNSIDLTDWAKRRIAQSLLPILIRRLIHATVNRVIRIGFPAEEAVQLRGWDGILEVLEGNAFVPDGVSAWELSTSTNSRSKANSDYESRCQNPLGITLDESTFIFMTPRIWRDKDLWIQERKQENIWRDIRVYDARDLVEWLEIAPAVSIWFSQLCGKRPGNVIDISNFSTDWSVTTRPELPLEFVLSGRNNVVDQIHTWLTDPTPTIALKADSRYEATIVFVAAIYQLLPEERILHLSRTLIVHNISDWYHLATSESPLILIPTFDCKQVLSRAISSGHKVVVPLGRADSISSTTVAIPRLSQEEAKKILINSGIKDERAHYLSKLARRSIQAFIRKLSIRPEVQQPEWSRPNNAYQLLPAMLIGSWDDSNESDKRVIAELAQISYEEVSRSLVRWSYETDPPVYNVGNIWSVISREDLWSLISQYLRRSDIERFERVALNVLGTLDPRFNLPIDQRWMAEVLIGPPQYSGYLHEGIAETLAMMGVHGDTMPLSARFSIQVYVNRIVRQLLKRANANWQLWATLSSILPLIAEACPEIVLSALDEALTRDSDNMLNLFTDHEKTHSYSSPHTGLLWALETLSWCPDYLGYSSLILAKLARIDPGGTLTNRPLDSLKAIFHLLIPQTTASLETRLNVLDSLRKNEPEITWQLLCKLLPTYHSVGRYTVKPRWRDWSSDSYSVTIKEYVSAIHEIVKRLLCDVEEDGNRWENLIEALPTLPDTEFDAILNRLASMAVDTLDPADRIIIWDALRKLLSKHRSFPSAKWALPKDRLTQINELYNRYEPQEFVKYKWLFDDHPTHPEGYKADFDTYQEILLKEQLLAIQKILTEHGFRGILELLSCVNRPDVLGSTLGQSEYLYDVEDEILREHLASEDTIYANFARGFAQGRIIKHGRDWAENKLHEVANEWTPSQRIELLKCLPRDERTWKIVESYDPETERSYWKEVYPYGIDKQDYQKAVRKLIEYGRPRSAIVLISVNSEHEEVFPSTLVVEALEQALQASLEVDPITSMFSYYVSELFDKLEPSREIEESQIAKLEWAYMPLLERHDRRPKLLHREISRNPAFFIDVLKLVITSEGEEQIEISEADQIKARLGLELLNSLRIIPGTRDDGSIDGNMLSEWVRQARELARASGRGVYGDRFIGQVLSNSPSDSDGVWPHPAICEVIETVASSDIELGFEMGHFNSRGVVMRPYNEGGLQERQLAEQYDAYSLQLRDRWPRVAIMLRRIADQYRELAQRWDRESELLEELDR